MYNPFQRPKALAIILGILIVLLGLFTLTLIIYTSDKGVIAKGVVLEFPLGNLRLEEAKSKLEQIKTDDLARIVYFTAEGKDFPINMKELGLTYTYEEELQQAYQIGRDGTLWNKAFNKFKARIKGITFKSQYQWNNQLLTATLGKSLSDLNIPAENARFSVTSKDTLEIVPEKPGKQVDIDSLITSVKQLPQNQTKSIPIPFKVVAPTITKAALDKLKMTEIGSYTTYFDPGQIGRTENIKLAAKALDGTLLKPEEVFSFNQIVGPRTVESGYQMAIIIEGDKFVPGLGGGVCQVSSTLYNAVQQASLSVVERSHHSLSVTYVPQGQDATVAYPTLDFKFKNDSGSYLLIRSKISNNTLTFALYGEKKESA